MSRVCARTIGRRTRISRYDGESVSSNGSNRLDQLNAFSRCMLRFTTRSIFSAISSPAAPFGASGPKRLKPGRLRPPQRECELISAYSASLPTSCDKALKDADGNTYPAKSVIALCRCGASTTKPFCDGTHSKVGFQAAEQAVPASKE